MVSDDDGLAAIPMVRDHGGWRRAMPGDGAAEALLGLLAATGDPEVRGRFTVRSWTGRPVTGERSVGVDQTNESVIVGDAAVVKWATRLQAGPHPAARRIVVLRDAGFGGMPTPWGLITWRQSDGTETLVASVDEFLPDAVDGWTWAVDLITAAAGAEPSVTPLTAAAGDVGGLIAELHAALATTVSPATQQDAARWRDAAYDTLERACGAAGSGAPAIARARRAEIERILDTLGSLAGTRVIDGHGDLHVGQVLRSGGRFAVTDFDGNPVLPAAQRMLQIPAALDVAGMAQSLSHAAIVARRYTPLDDAALAAADAAARTAFLAAYTARLTALGRADIYDPGALTAFRMQQVLREIVYAAGYLPRWMYVPDAALPALLDEGTPREG